MILGLFFLKILNTTKELIQIIRKLIAKKMRIFMNKKKNLQKMDFFLEI